LTADKRAREQRLRDRRARKEAKKAAKKQAAADADNATEVGPSSAESESAPLSHRFDLS
jgi:hypothetical protein